MARTLECPVCGGEVAASLPYRCASCSRSFGWKYIPFQGKAAPLRWTLCPCCSRRPSLESWQSEEEADESASSFCKHCKEDHGHNTGYCGRCARRLARYHSAQRTAGSYGAFAFLGFYLVLVTLALFLWPDLLIGAVIFGAFLALPLAFLAEALLRKLPRLARDLRYELYEAFGVEKDSSGNITAIWCRLPEAAAHFGKHQD